MGAKERIARLEERLDRQEVSRLLALPLEEVIELLPDLSERVHDLYLRLLSDDALIHLARRVYRLIAAYDLGISEEALTEEEFQAWWSENPRGMPRAHGAGFGPD